MSTHNLVNMVPGVWRPPVLMLSWVLSMAKPYLGHVCVHMSYTYVYTPKRKKKEGRKEGKRERGEEGEREEGKVVAGKEG